MPPPSKLSVVVIKVRYKVYLPKDRRRNGRSVGSMFARLDPGKSELDFAIGQRFLFTKSAFF
jgi:hypothetical protein